MEANITFTNLKRSIKRAAGSLMVDMFHEHSVRAKDIKSLVFSLDKELFIVTDSSGKVYIYAFNIIHKRTVDVTGEYIKDIPLLLSSEKIVQMDAERAYKEVQFRINQSKRIM